MIALLACIWESFWGLSPLDLHPHGNCVFMLAFWFGLKSGGLKPPEVVHVHGGHQFARHITIKLAGKHTCGTSFGLSPPDLSQNLLASKMEIKCH